MGGEVLGNDQPQSTVAVPAIKANLLSMRQLISLASLVLSACAAASAATPHASQNDAVDELFSSMDRPDHPGAAVLVMKDGQVVHRQGYGSANLEHRIPITPTTVFDIASVSKQFAGIAVAMLVEDGEIGLDDDVRVHVPEVPDFGQTITIDHLVHHTSGLRDWPGTLAVAGWQMDDVISFEQILTLVKHQQDLNFAPGSRHSYSNTGYNVLAELVQRVSGQSFRSFMEERVFEPLGMEDTHFQDDHTELIPDRAWGYRRNGPDHAVIPNGLTALGSSSLFTTVDDLAKWMANFENPEVGGPEVIARMEQRGVLNSGTTIDYAFGQGRGTYRGATFWRHGGSWAGSRTVVMRVPEHRFGVVILSNSASFDATAKSLEIVDLLLGDVLDPPEEEQITEDDATEEAVEVAHTVLDRYAGTYKLGPGWLLTITRDGDRLMTEATNEDRFPTIARSESEFHVPAYGASLRFDPQGNGPVPRLRYKDITAPRVMPFDTSTELADYAGAYASEELATGYVVEVKDEHLIAHHRRHAPIVLKPIGRDEFKGDTWFFNGVEFERDQAGQVVEMRVSNGRSLGLRFAKE